MSRGLALISHRKLSERHRPQSTTRDQPTLESRPCRDNSGPPDKYQSIEKSLSLIIERLVSMAEKKITRPIFTNKICHGPWTRIHQLAQNQNDRTSIVPCTSFEDRMQTKKTHRPTYFEKSKILQSNNAKRHRIVMKFGTALPARVSTASNFFSEFLEFI